MEALIRGPAFFSPESVAPHFRECMAHERQVVHIATTGREFRCVRLEYSSQFEQLMDEGDTRPAVKGPAQNIRIQHLPATSMGHVSSDFGTTLNQPFGNQHSHGFPVCRARDAKVGAGFHFLG